MDKIAKWLERLNLLPFVLLISAYHYIQVLKISDPFFIAISFAIMFDLGHFQIVTLAVRYMKRDERNLFGMGVRWFFAVLTTYVSFHYHSMYYDALPAAKQLAYSAPLPIFIIVLAWYYEFREDNEEESMDQMLARILGAEKSDAPGEKKLTCPECGRTGYKNQNSLNGHMKRHRLQERKKAEALKAGEPEKPPKLPGPDEPIDITTNYITKAKPKPIDNKKPEPKPIDDIAFEYTVDPSSWDKPDEK